ncbi:MAG: AMP-binding protein [Bryobacteraceae bacterium]|nr:AMP-binding protein [Bryobacteraceae bacterium]
MAIFFSGHAPAAIINSLTLPDLFDLSLLGRAGEPALEWYGRTFTFGEIDQRASRMAAALAARGLTPGSRLCVYLPNSLDYIDLFLAATRLGVIFVPVNILYRDREIAHILNDADPVAVVASESQVEHLPAGAPLLPIEQLRREAESAPATRSVLVNDGDAPAAIVYTSGTTGASKGAVLSHNVFAVNALNILTCWRITAEDRLLLTLPLFHVHGLGNGLHAWLISGCRLRLTPRFEHEHATHWLEEFQTTLFFGVPTMYVRLLETHPEAAHRIGARMRLFVSGSAPLPAQTLEDFRRLFAHTILERYGMSETLMNISNPYVGERRPGSVGLPLPGVSVRNLDPQGEPVEDGETGELHLRGPNVFSGYWRRPDSTAAAFRDGWFRSGDLAVRDADGYYTLQGRRSDLIISGGFNIYPREIEEFLMEQPGVAEVAVAGVPDPLKGEVAVAYIVPSAPFDAASLEAQCRAHLASFKVPRQFIAVDRIPRTALGKVQKHLLPRP